MSLAILKKRFGGKKVFVHGRASRWADGTLFETAKLYGVVITKTLDKSVGVVVLRKGVTKGIQQQVAGLNAKGATINMIEMDDFKEMVKPTLEEYLQLVRAGNPDSLRKAISEVHWYSWNNDPEPYQVAAESFSKCNLKKMNVEEARFEGCDFRGSDLTGARIGNAGACDFRGITVSAVGKLEIWLRFNNVTDCNFTGVKLERVAFERIDGCDFTAASIPQAKFDGDSDFNNKLKKPKKPSMFRGAKMPKSEIKSLHLNDTDFSGADLSGSYVSQCVFENADFRGANLRSVNMTNQNFKGADFTGADLTGAVLAGSDFAGANFDGADLSGVNFRNAKLKNSKLAKAKNYVASDGRVHVTPAMTTLDAVGGGAQYMSVSFEVKAKNGKVGGAGISTWKKRSGFHLPDEVTPLNFWDWQAKTFSEALAELSNHLDGAQILYPTLKVKTTNLQKKLRKPPTELRRLAVEAIASVTGQTPPATEELEKAGASHREKEKKKRQAESLKWKKRVERIKANEEADRQKEIKKIEAKTGKVSDIGSFMTALGVRIDAEKIKKATSMLKASGFELYNDVTNNFISGVVKSQTDPDLVYACRIEEGGKYSCCTQNLNICGGLRGSICKHTLVLIIGLVQAGKIDPATIDAWIGKTHGIKAELDKETMGAIFIKYKGAEAGEVDWRPTETTPEDYYAL